MSVTSLTILLIAVGVVLGQTVVTIDDYTTSSPTLIVFTQSATTYPTATSNFVSSSGGDILGDERDLQLTAIYGRPNSVLALSATGNAESGSTPNGAAGNALAQYDGTDGSIALNPAGLYFVAVTDWIQAGGTAVEAFAQADIDTTITFNIYSGSAGSYCTASVLVVSSSNYQPYAVRFGDFVAVGSGCDFSSVGAVEVLVNMGENVDFAIGSLNVVAVPSSPSPSSTPAPSESVTPSPSDLKTQSRTSSRSVTPSRSATRTASPSASPSKTSSASPSLTRTPSPSSSKSSTVSESSSASSSAAPSATATVSTTGSISESRTQTVTPTPSKTATKSESASISVSSSISTTGSESRTSSVSVTSSATASVSRSSSVTPSQSRTRSASKSASISETASATSSRSISLSRTSSRTPTASRTPSKSSTGTISVSKSPSSTRSISRTPSNSRSPSKLI